MMDEKRSPLQALRACWQDKRRRTVLLIYLRYALPLAAAFLLLVLGCFYNVSAMQLGRPVKVSALRLLFNTLKSARTYLLGDTVSEGVRNFYVMLIVGVVLLLVFFLIGVAVSVFALYTLQRVRAAVATGDGEEQKQRKILFCAFVPNRVLLCVLQVAIVSLALFPELFSFVCSRFLAVSGTQSLYVRFNPVLMVVGVLLIAMLVLAIALRKSEGVVLLDLFDMDGEQNDTVGEDDGEDGDDEPAEDTALDEGDAYEGEVTDETDALPHTAESNMAE